MASSNASVGAPSRNTSHENVVPLESIFTGEPSGPPDHRPVSAWADPGGIAKHWDILESQRAVLGRLKAWHQWDTDRYESLSTYLMSKAGFPKRPICPTRDELLSLVTYFFPPRRSLKVVVCDFGAYRCERSEIRLEELAQCRSLSRSWCEDLTFGHFIRLAGQARVGDCTVDVLLINPNALDVTDSRRHLPLGSGRLESVRQHLITPFCNQIEGVD